QRPERHVDEPADLVEDEPRDRLRRTRADQRPGERLLLLRRRVLSLDPAQSQPRQEPRGRARDHRLGLGSHLAKRIISSANGAVERRFPLAAMLAPLFKDRPTGLLERGAQAVSVSRTGRCEPRRAYLALPTAVSNLEEPVAPTPPSDGLFQFWSRF